MMNKVINFLEIGQFKGSDGSILGCGTRMMPWAERLNPLSKSLLVECPTFSESNITSIIDYFNIGVYKVES